MHKNFMPDDLQKRVAFLKNNFNNAQNAEQFFKIIFD
jgi:hypothetical protein